MKWFIVFLGVVILVNGAYWFMTIDAEAWKWWAVVIGGFLIGYFIRD